MNQPLNHPLTSGTKVFVARRRELTRETVVECEGQLGNSKTWWYKMDTGKRASEYDILNTIDHK